MHRRAPPAYAPSRVEPPFEFFYQQMPVPRPSSLPPLLGEPASNLIQPSMSCYRNFRTGINPQLK